MGSIYSYECMVSVEIDWHRMHLLLRRSVDAWVTLRATVWEVGVILGLRTWLGTRMLMSRDILHG